MQATWPGGLKPPSNVVALCPGGRGAATLVSQARRLLFDSVRVAGPPGASHTQASMVWPRAPRAHATTRPRPPVTGTWQAADPRGLGPSHLPPPPKVGARECRVPGRRSSITPSPAGHRRPSSPH
ncbi:hypothetical protein NDU88_007021 [Pleurodeles waltl]|uniref:Uncharacterized protein n=1 Tax=Pleurodeles waltl TaxID=8319 RepID=A0AAV7NW64_PLEWA|nr:hypothetical protein NDU88_007021 [Pleurodeles waltl]